MRLSPISTADVPQDNPSFLVPVLRVMACSLFSTVSTPNMHGTRESHDTYSSSD